MTSRAVHVCKVGVVRWWKIVGEICVCGLKQGVHIGGDRSKTHTNEGKFPDTKILQK